MLSNRFSLMTGLNGPEIVESLKHIVEEAFSEGKDCLSYFGINEANGECEDEDDWEDEEWQDS